MFPAFLTNPGLTSVFFKWNMLDVEYVRIYKCLCDGQRLRIVNLLREGPLGVCHLMEIREADQVKISKQLGYMKKLGMVESERVAQWMVYRLANGEEPLLQENLKCLQDCYADEVCFREDGEKRKVISRRVRRETPVCARALEGMS